MSENLASLAQQIRTNRMKQSELKIEYEALCSDFIKYLGSQKSYEYDNIQIYVKEDYDYDKIDFEQFKNELQKYLKPELIDILVQNSQKRIEMSGGLNVKIK